MSEIEDDSIARSFQIVILRRLISTGNNSIFKWADIRNRNEVVEELEAEAIYVIQFGFVYCLSEFGRYYEQNNYY
jgi:hypothetical protein